MSSTSQETCWTLIHAAARGQLAEREELTRRYLPAVRAYLTARWRNSSMRDEIDDGAQEVFLACFREGGALQRVDRSAGPGFRAFLYGVTRNVALHLERARARRDDWTASEPESEIPDREPSLASVYDRAYAGSLMREAAQVMSARARESGGAAARRVEILRLRFEQGLPIRDIARLWGTDASDLHLEYAKAAREFRAALGEVAGLSERCAPEHLERECDRLLDMLR